MSLKNMWKRPWICRAHEAESGSHGLGNDLQLYLLTKGLQPSPTAIGFTDCVLKNDFSTFP